MPIYHKPHLATQYLFAFEAFCLSFFGGYIKIWKQKLVQMGAAIEERLSKRVTHVFAINSEALLKQVAAERLERFKGVSLSSCLAV